MTSSPRAVVNVAELPMRWLERGSRFKVGLGDIDGTLGLAAIGATLHVVPAGKTAWPFHRHHGCDELFMVLEGTGEVRMGDRRLPLKAGDLIGAPAGGEAHQIINSSAGELRYIAFASRGRADVIEYPDSGRIAVDIMHDNDRQPRSFLSLGGRLTPTEYWEGEDVDRSGDSGPSISRQS